MVLDMKIVKRFKCFSVISSCILTVLFASHNASAMGDKFAMGVNLDVRGLGVEGRTPIMPQLFGRLGANYFGYKHDFNDGEIDLKAKLRLISVPLMLDYHPFADSGFRLSAGATYNGNELKAKGRPMKSVVLFGRTYQPSQIGQVSTRLKLGNNIAGVLSVGYDSSLITDSSFSFACEFGVVFSGKPKLSVNTSAAESLINSSGATQQQKNVAMQVMRDVKKDAQKSLDKASKYLRYYPVISVGFKYNF